MYVKDIKHQKEVSSPSPKRKTSLPRANHCLVILAERSIFEACHQSGTPCHGNLVISCANVSYYALISERAFIAQYHLCLVAGREAAHTVLRHHKLAAGSVTQRRSVDRSSPEQRRHHRHRSIPGLAGRLESKVGRVEHCSCYCNRAERCCCCTGQGAQPNQFHRRAGDQPYGDDVQLCSCDVCQ